MRAAALLCFISVITCAEASSPQLGPLQVPSPDWRDQVIYFAMTDRFNDGNPANNDQGKGEYDPSQSSHYSGGDLVGVRQKLDYIQGLGATALWLTPPVANQWWSDKAQYGGYHGYWAVDFMAVDSHLGTLADYQALSRDLHGRGMYLVQDIVVNHTANLFGYDGPYDPTDPAKNFHLFEQAPLKSQPWQSPFQLYNRLDPAHARAEIYHWTPPVQNPDLPGQEFQYQVGLLADLNTSNLKVRQVLKHSYRYWLEAVGVDAYRLDTAKYVEHEFWHDFFHAPDGIQAKARELGKKDFLTFGEVFESGAPFTNKGEQKLKSFLGTEEKPELNSVIAFPLYFELNKVLAEGQPPAQLAYRLAQHSELFATPHRLPTFLNNHDTKRFLSSGSPQAFLQAYAVIFTIPGIPVIYQGDEQLLTQSRQAMFKTGWGSGGRDWFDNQSPMYQALQSLIKLRKTHQVLRHGHWQLLQAESTGPGVLAYQMQLDSERVLVLLNTADQPRLASGIALQAPSATVLWQTGFAADGKPASTHLAGNSTQQLDVTLPARSVLVLSPSNTPVAKAVEPLMIQFANWPVTPLSQDLQLLGQGPASTTLQPVLDGNPARLPTIATDQQGRFQFTLPVRDFGKASHQLRFLAPQSGAVSQSFSYSEHIEEPAFQVTVHDARQDDHGFNGQYQPPKHLHSQQQRDIVALSAQGAGAVLELKVTMAQVSQFWAPPNGFDNVHFALFFQFPAPLAALPAPKAALPLLQTSMPSTANSRGGQWQLGHYLFGWGNALFTTQGADSDYTGAKLAAAPNVTVDKAKGTITIRYDGNAFGVTDWAGVTIYLSTWDKSGEGQIRNILPTPSEWQFSAPDVRGPKVMDDLLLRIPTLH